MKSLFLAWADRDVTDELPKGDWLPWRAFLEQRQKEQP